LVISVAFHHVVAYARSLRKGIDILLVLNWIDLLVVLVGLLLGFEVLVTVEGQVSTNIAVTETFLPAPIFFELVLCGLHNLL